MFVKHQGCPRKQPMVTATIFSTAFQTAPLLGLQSSNGLLDSGPTSQVWVLTTTRWSRASLRARDSSYLTLRRGLVSSPTCDRHFLSFEKNLWIQPSFAQPA